MSYTSCLMQLKTQTKAAFYALEAVITELEATRDRLLSGFNRPCCRSSRCLGGLLKRLAMSRTVPQAEAARSVVVRLRGHRANMSDDYFQVILLIERLHRQFLDLVKLELDALRVYDVNNVQP